jgi:single-strand DNA-binding protein
MTDIITLTGLVATNPRHIVTTEGLAITSFRLASNQRRFDRTQNSWIDGDTNWYTITAFRQLGAHVATSVDKGQRVIVTGRVRIRDWENGAKSGTTIEIDADAVGHDLTWGRATFTRSIIAAKPGSTGSASSDASTDQFAGKSEDDDQILGAAADAAADADAEDAEADDAAEFASAGASRPF